MHLKSLRRRPIAEQVALKSLRRRPIAEQVALKSLPRRPIAEQVALKSLQRRPIAEQVALKSLRRPSHADPSPLQGLLARLLADGASSLAVRPPSQPCASPSRAALLSSLAVGGAPDRTSTAARRAALSAAAGAELFVRLAAAARRWGASPEDAEDLAQTALMKFWAGDWAWDPEAHRDVKRYLMGIVRSEVSHERRSARRRYETTSDSVEDAVDAAPSAVEDARRRDAECTQALAELRASLAEDAPALRVVELIEEGVDKPAAQAARLRVPVSEIYDALDRIGRRVRRIARGRSGMIDEEVAE